ncbi:LD-carboxypeptidase [Synechococcus sp. CS-602]|uniref:S66 peptidase family protein n=1 Tax=Synechococcaceae TaxID=1890426 RepID=UPI0008FF62D6|nr:MULTISPECIES: LD-carboxypeptidase [Synechococcaceae]MCT4365531.1 LD-carboxypeptidase [Candidatus Regnicoccus frigidus MAG-AL1]APD47457.1 LD-carboxypeptidase [Synechococcus sp. SynAce01]MCT0202597.1 LD-carboxypeptidase [Synechococcus sp. CS-603]MCT0204401.1 LD-carboxypeptidase [Synechococcus sp. CS-602]MCT0247243.1 LD-carboxypeptidase [Synechococcus sp. CS-601]
MSASWRPARPVLSPPPLRPGERVGLVAASSALGDPGRLEQGVAVLEDWGLVVERPFDPGRRWGYMAGDDQQRRGDLEARARLLACVRGGWGSARLLEQPLPEQAGWLLGYSDVTSLLWARLALGLGGGIHGPMVTGLASEPEWSQQRLRALLFGEPLPPLQGEPWQGGVAEGPLLVANLTVATHLLGTPFLPPLAGAVLILEDVGEAPYRIERLLTHWRLCGALQQLAGLGFGSFLDCDDPVESSEPPQHRFSLEQVLRERTADLGIPVVGRLPVGHAPGNGALPLGRLARLDGDSGRLSLIP